MKPRNGLASRFAIMAQRKNRRLPRSYANPVMNKGSHAKISAFLSPAVIGSVTKRGLANKFYYNRILDI